MNFCYQEDHEENLEGKNAVDIEKKYISIKYFYALVGCPPSIP